MDEQEGAAPYGSDEEIQRVKRKREESEEGSSDSSNERKKKQSKKDRKKKKKHRKDDSSLSDTSDSEIEKKRKKKDKKKKKKRKRKEKRDEKKRLKSKDKKKKKKRRRHDSSSSSSDEQELEERRKKRRRGSDESDNQDGSDSEANGERRRKKKVVISRRNPNLPDEWEERWSRTKREFYFHNNKTGHSYWKLPDDVKLKNQEEQASPRSNSPLPAGVLRRSGGIRVTGFDSLDLPDAGPVDEVDDDWAAAEKEVELLNAERRSSEWYSLTFEEQKQRRRAARDEHITGIAKQFLEAVAKFKNPDGAATKKDEGEASSKEEKESKGKEKEKEENAEEEKEEQESKSTSTTEGENGEKEEPTNEAKDKEPSKSDQATVATEQGKDQAYPCYPFREQGTFPDVELVRHGEIQHLQRYLRNSCRDNGMNYEPINSFQRWLFVRKMTEIANGEWSDEPLLPVRIGIDIGLKDELEEAGVDPDRAADVCLSLAAQSVTSAEVVHREHLECTEGRRSNRVLEEKFAMYRDLTYEDFGVRINEDRYEQLLKEYNEHTPNEEDKFIERLFCMLVRYESLAGPGYQKALPEASFKLLQDCFGISHECFASPLNHYLPSYGSAFYDTDKYFGSKGDMFGLTIPEEGGSFEANPPFVEETMMAMALFIEDVLSADKTNPHKPLCFVVIVPGWADTPSYHVMAKSPHLTKQLTFAKNRHLYKEGNQHRKRLQYKSSECATFVFFLQNESGAVKWPVTEEAVARFTTTFTSAV